MDQLGVAEILAEADRLQSRSRQGRPAFLARRQIVSSTSYLASMAGLRMFALGGNAIDAGIAAGIALNVVERQSCDFGGVAPIMVFRPGMRRPETIDGVGRWPRGLSLTALLKRHGGTMPPGLARAVTPAAPDAWLTTLARHGSLRLADVMGPAIELCDGFPVSENLAVILRLAEPNHRMWPASASVFLREGRPPRPGELLAQPDLRALLRHLVSTETSNQRLGRAEAIMAARNEFYRGEVARQIAAFVEGNGGALTFEDLAEYRVSTSDALASTYRGMEVYACGPWSQGPVVPIILNILEGYDLGALDPRSAVYLHRCAEAVKLAYADREAFFGDPDFVDVPLTGLLDKGYAEERRAMIADDRAWPDMPSPGDPWRYEGRIGRVRGATHSAAPAGNEDTAFVCALDAEGNAFSATPSDHPLSGPLIDGLGIMVSDRGGQSWLDASHPSAMGPWKRPRLTPNPALLMRDGKVLMALGAVGGDAQPQAMVQVICAIRDFGTNAQMAVELPRVTSASFPSSFYPHGYEAGLLLVEERVPVEARAQLAGSGHNIRDLPPYSTRSGAACAVRVVAAGTLEGAADPRGDGYAVGW